MRGGPSEPGMGQAEDGRSLVAVEGSIWPCAKERLQGVRAAAGKGPVRVPLQGKR